MNAQVRNIIERVTVLRDEAAEQADRMRNLWTGRDIRNTINELLLMSLDARREAFDAVLKAIEEETAE